MGDPLILLYIIPFLHQTTTVRQIFLLTTELYIIPFLHQTATSTFSCRLSHLLYIIPFLHQTTTYICTRKQASKLYIIPFLHQTTTISPAIRRISCCISSLSYIKPQLKSIFPPIFQAFTFVFMPKKWP